MFGWVCLCSKSMLVNGIPTPLKNMSSPVDTIIPNNYIYILYGNIKFMFQTTNQFSMNLGKSPWFALKFTCGHHSWDDVSNRLLGLQEFTKKKITVQFLEIVTPLESIIYPLYSFVSPKSCRCQTLEHLKLGRFTFLNVPSPSGSQLHGWLFFTVLVHWSSRTN